MILVELCLEFFEQGKGVRRSSREARENLVVIQLSYLLCVVFHHRRTDGYLAVSGDHGLAVPPHRKNGRCMHGCCFDHEPSDGIRVSGLPSCPFATIYEHPVSTSTLLTRFIRGPISFSPAGAPGRTFPSARRC